MMTKFSVFVIFVLYYSLVDVSDATLCTPLSTFKIDCNLCRCTEDGRQYTCNEKPCPTPDSNRFIKETTKEGFVLLRPKFGKQDQDGYDADEYVLTRRLRRSHQREIPYINDEIPPSAEADDDVMVDNGLGEQYESGSEDHQNSAENPWANIDSKLMINDLRDNY